MQSVLFTVFRTDSVEKINIWVSTRENLSPGRLKSAYQLQRVARILKKIVLQIVLSVFLCLFLAVLWVCLETAIVFFF